MDEEEVLHVSLNHDDEHFDTFEQKLNVVDDEQKFDPQPVDLMFVDQEML